MWQIAVLFVVWVYLWSLQLDNDGLWYQGDASRHAMNGFFWADYLRDFTLDAKGYALSYYARYPAIDPASRPPFFYLLEGAAFTLLGPSPYVAKGLVLCFALLAAVYLWAWLRRWISEEAGWAVGLFLLLPGINRWSHAVMLNVPALALSMAALYHARCWLEAPRTSTRDFWLATVLTVLAILTYYPAGIVLLIIAGWIIIRRRWGALFKSKRIVPITLAILGLLPFVWFIVLWAPTPLRWTVPRTADLGKLSNWTFYFDQVLLLCNWHLVRLAAVGIIVGVWKPRWRQETLMLVTWLLVMYVAFSLIPAREIRYLLLLSAPLIGLAGVAVIQLCEWLCKQTPALRTIGQNLTVMTFLLLLVLQVHLAANYHVASVSGYQEVVSFLAQVAPEEPVFYDGFSGGNFIFYVRAGDDHLRRRVVIGDKLLYAYAMHAGWRQQEFAHSPEEVIEVLRQRGGCRWLAIEVGERTEAIAPMRYLRQAVKTAAFELVRSFPIVASHTNRVDVYRLKLPVAQVDEVELPFPVLGSDVKYRARPIPSRRSDHDGS